MSTIKKKEKKTVETYYNLNPCCDDLELAITHKALIFNRTIGEVKLPTKIADCRRYGYKPLKSKITFCPYCGKDFYEETTATEIYVE